MWSSPLSHATMELAMHMDFKNFEIPYRLNYVNINEASICYMLASSYITLKILYFSGKLCKLSHSQDYKIELQREYMQL